MLRPCHRPGNSLFSVPNVTDEEYVEAVLSAAFLGGFWAADTMIERQ